MDRKKLENGFLGKLPLFYSIYKIRKKQETISILKTLASEVLDHPGAKRCRKETNDAINKKIRHSILREAWDLILRENVPKSANEISGSFIIIIKDVETENPTFKARFMAHGNK